MYVSITEAKAHLEKLVARVLRGDEVIICRWGTPVARLEPIVPLKYGRKLAKHPRRLPSAAERDRLASEE